MADLGPGLVVESFTSPECAHDRHWTHYVAETSVRQLSALQYRTALAVRCKLIPDNIRDEIGTPALRCDCDKGVLLCCKNLTAQQEAVIRASGTQMPLLEHIVNCAALHKIYYVERHDYVKDALRHVANRYGIRTHIEPNYYAYASGQHNRPDITFCIQDRAYIATDVTVVQPSDSRDVTAIGVEAAKAAEKKVQKHSAAVHQMNHVFIPFALETTGHMDVGCYTLINQLKNTIPFDRRIDFSRDMKAAVSIALAQYRAEVLLGTLTHVRTRS